MTDRDQIPLNLETPAERRAWVRAAVARIAPDLAALALRKGRYGIDARDTRQLAVAHGLVTGGESGRSLSWLSAVPRAAGLIPNGLRDDYHNGNRPMSYILSTFRSPS